MEEYLSWYFGYASNMDLISLRAKGVEPSVSKRALLPGWRLRFNVRHFFRHEGGVANIERTDERTDAVWGVLHLCDDAHLALLDAAEANGHGYARISVRVFTQQREQEAVTYVGIPSFIDEGCRPSRRYLNILVRGATEAQIDSDYVDALRRHPVHQPPPVPIFVPPPGDHPIFTATTLMRHPTLTALAGAVFDMTGARWQHHFLCQLFGGKDMTLFHLKRLDTSDGSETLDDIKYDRLTPAQRRYLDEYLHEYSAEYVYAGRYVYD
jgi:sulfite reductase (NADPH) flavoprotein alpha-component